MFNMFLNMFWIAEGFGYMGVCHVLDDIADLTAGPSMYIVRRTIQKDNFNNIPPNFVHVSCQCQFLQSMARQPERTLFTTRNCYKFLDIFLDNFTFALHCIGK